MNSLNTVNTLNLWLIRIAPSAMVKVNRIVWPNPSDINHADYSICARTYTYIHPYTSYTGKISNIIIL